MVRLTGLRNDPVDLHHREPIHFDQIVLLLEELVRHHPLIPTYLQIVELLIALGVDHLVISVAVQEVLLSGAEMLQEAIEEDQDLRHDDSHQEERKDQDHLCEGGRGLRTGIVRHDHQEVEGLDLHL